MDKLNQKERSINMSKIKSKNTKPELFVRKQLSSYNIRYRCNVKDLPGKPDIAIKKYKIALDIKGCFWHGHKNCKNFRYPKSNIEFWKNKIRKNILRDHSNKKKYDKMNYEYITIWECELKNGSYIDKLNRFMNLINESK